MFYWSKLFTSELESGEYYGKLKQTVTVNILNFVLFPERSSYHAEVVTVLKDTNELFYDKFHIHFFELKKLSKRYNVNNRRELWLQFINAESEEDFDMLEKTNDPVMKKAVHIIYDMSEDTKLREIARLREKALHDEASLLNNARAEGRAEGEAAAKAALIANMRALGMSDEQINKICGKM